jgi:hypothetical protein
MKRGGLLAAGIPDIERTPKDRACACACACARAAIRRVLAELNDMLALGDDILRELRLLLSPKYQSSLTRA